MQTVMTTTNGGDWVLLVDGENVVGAWEASVESVADYVRDGHAADDWDATYPDETSVADYGDVIGENGRIDNVDRARFWMDQSNEIEVVAALYGMTDPLISPSAVAEIHGCGTRTIQGAIKDGRLPAEPLLGPNREPTSWGVRETVALTFEPRNPGRPSKV